MTAFVIGAGSTQATRVNMSGTDTLLIEAGGMLNVSANAQSVRFNGPTTDGQITNNGLLTNSASGGRAIRIETSVGSSFTASITNGTNATISSGDDAIQIQAGVVTAGSLTVLNSGAINSSIGQALDLAGGLGNFQSLITNNAGGSILAGASDAIRLFSGSVTNRGTINGGEATGYTIGADGVQVEDNGTATISNFGSGQIIGDRHGVNGGAGTTVTVINGAVGDTTPTITGNNGSGVGIDGSGSVTNYGTITGRYANAQGSDTNGNLVGEVNGGAPDGVNDGDGDGVDIDGQATINNYGTISATGAGGTGSDGRPNTADGIAAGGGTINNYAGATIESVGRAILIDNSATGPAPFATTITNDGSISGTQFGIVLVGTQNDRVDNAGTISTAGTYAIQFGAGDDTLRLRAGSSITGLSDGEGGTDTLDYSGWIGSGVTVSLASGAATGTGGISNFEAVIGSAQDDLVQGFSPAESLSGGAGNDVLNGGAGNDTLLGEAGNDTLQGDAGDDSLDGGANRDTVAYNNATAAVLVSLSLQGQVQNTLGAGNDFLSGFEQLNGSAFNDTLGGDDQDNILSGADGNDILLGIGGNDTLFGGNGNDTLYGGDGNDSMSGSSGSDVYVVDQLGDIVGENSAGGTDIAFVTVTGWTSTSDFLETIYLYGAATQITGSAGPNQLVANNAGLDSSLTGGASFDTLWGGAGNDTLTGGGDEDTLRAGAGNDVLAGGTGNDKLVGGDGGDRFVYNATGWGYDQVFDFVRGEDRFDFRGSGITGLGQLTIYETGGSSVVAFNTSRIDVYGVTGLAASDFIFT